MLQLLAKMLLNSVSDVSISVSQIFWRTLLQIRPGNVISKWPIII